MLVIFALAVSDNPEVTDRDDEIFNEAEKMIAASQFWDAYLLLGNKIPTRRDSGSPRLYRLHTFACQGMKKWKEMIWNSEAILQLSNSPEFRQSAYLFLAQAHSQLGNFTIAKNYAEKASDPIFVKTVIEAITTKKHRRTLSQGSSKRHRLFTNSFSVVFLTLHHSNLNCRM
jgi:hypothetical protein